MQRNIVRGKSLSLRAGSSVRMLLNHTLILSIAAICMLSVRAGGQGAADVLPSPISTGELVRYMQQLELSEQQQIAATAMHDEYKRSYQSLYENEIRDFLELMRSMSGFNVPERDELEKMTRDMRKMEARIRSLDVRMFDQMQTILTDDQLATMPRVRLARKRATYNQQQAMQMWTMGSPLVDLSAVITDLDLRRSEIETIDSLIARYESNITTKMAKLNDSASTLWLDLYDGIEAAGIDLQQLRDMDNAEDIDPEEMQKLMETMQQLFMDLTAKGRADVDNIRKTNRDTVRSFKGLVHEDTYRLIRNAYYVRGYPSIAAMTYSSPYHLRDLTELSDLTDAQRTEATDMIRLALQDIDRLVEQAVDLTDEFRASFDFMDFDQEEFSAHQKKLQTLQEQATEIGDSLNKRLAELIGADHAQQLVSLGVQRLKNESNMHAAAVVAARQAAVETEEQVASNEDYAYMGYSSDQYLPARINRRDLSIYYDLMDATEEQKLIIGELFDGYLEAIKSVEQNEVQKVVDAQSKIWRWGSEGEVERDWKESEQSIDDVAKFRVSAMAAIAAADKNFFDEAELLITDELRLTRLERVRQLRARQRLNTQGMQSYGYGWGDPSREAQIDVVEFIARKNLDDESRAAVEPILIEYENTVLPLFEQRYERAVEFQRTQEKWTIRWQQIQEEESSAAANAKLMSEYQDTIGASQKALTAASDQLAEINSATMDRVLSTATTADTQAIRDDYNRKAFPSVYDDGDAVQPLVDAALQLETLMPAQRESMFDLQAEYRPSYDDICRKMLDLSRDAPAPNWGTDTDDWRKYQEYQDSMQHLKFERTELNSRALLRLHQILNEAQIEEMGGLPEIAEKSDANPVHW